MKTFAGCALSPSGCRSYWFPPGRVGMVNLSVEGSESTPSGEKSEGEGLCRVSIVKSAQRSLYSKTATRSRALKFGEAVGASGTTGESFAQRSVSRTGSPNTHRPSISLSR